MENDYDDNKEIDENNNENNLKNNLYEILPEDYPNCDKSFKIYVVGNSGKKQNI